MSGRRSRNVLEIGARYLREYAAMYPRERSFYGFFPFGAAYMGIHDGDGTLADFSAGRVMARLQELERWQGELGRAESQIESIEDRTDLEILAWVCDAERFALTEIRPHQTSPLHYNDTVDVSGYFRRNYAPFAERMARLRDHLRAVPGALEAGSSNLQRSLPEIPLRQAIEAFRGHRQYLGDDLRATTEQLDDQGLRAEIDQAAQETVAALDAFIADLESRLPQAHDDFALGEERFLGLLRSFELVDLPLDDLRRHGESDLQRNRAWLEETCARIDPDAGIREVMDRISRNHPAWDRLLPAAEDVLGDLRGFIVDNRLVSIPEDVEPVVAETPPFQRWGFASMDSPGAFEPPQSGAHYHITSPEPDWSDEQKEQWMRRFFDAAIVNTSAHEVYPGHYVQSMHKRQAPTDVQKAFDSFTHWEAWAHYSEQMILDAGYLDDDTQQRVAQLYAALLRNARYMVAIGLHCDSMSVDQATEFIMETTLMDELPARREAERGTFDPGYGNYNLGKQMLLKLRADVEREKGSRFDLGAFHDAFLAHGAPPFPILRRRLLAEDDGRLL